MKTKSIIAVAVLGLLFFGFQNCSNSMKPAGSSVANLVGQSSAPSVFGTYLLSNIQNITYENLGGSSASTHPLISVAISDSTSQLLVNYSMSDGRGQCSYVLGATDYQAYASYLTGLTLGVDSSTTANVAGNLHLEILLNGAANKLDFLFDNGSNSNGVKVIMNGSALASLVNSYLSVGCNASMAFGTVPLNSITGFDYFNNATPDAGDPARSLSVVYAANSPTVSITKTLSDPTSDDILAQCSRSLSSSEIASLLASLRSSTYGADTGNVVISNSGDNILMISAYPLDSSGAIVANSSPFDTDYRFQGGDTTHAGNVIFGGTLQQLLEGWLDNFDCAIPN